MNPTYNRAPAPGSNGGQSGRAGTSTIARNSDFPRLSSLGCPAGCGAVHECGVGKPVDLPPAGPHSLGGRDLTIQGRDVIGALWLDLGCH